jgi:hypothetical protein
VPDRKHDTLISRIHDARDLWCGGDDADANGVVTVMQPILCIFLRRRRISEGVCAPRLAGARKGPSACHPRREAEFGEEKG